jgi:hypothetical protein
LCFDSHFRPPRVHDAVKKKVGCWRADAFRLFVRSITLRRELVGISDRIRRGSVASIVRMLYLHTITVPTGEFFVNISKLSIWSTVEPGVGITVASLATLRPLFSKLVERTRRASNASYSSQHQSSSADNAYTHPASMKTQTRDDSVGMNSKSIIVSPFPHRLLDDTCQASSKYSLPTSKEEKIEDIEAETRAYGMSGLNKCATLDEENFDQDTPQVWRERETQRRCGDSSRREL